MRWYKLLYVFGVLCASFFLFSYDAKAAPATFTVTNTNDTGAGSLREAILDANNNGNPSDMDVIEFTIPGSGVHTITPQSVLPNVSEKLTIDGYTQPGAQQNSAVAPNPLNNVIKIELDLGSIPSSNRDKLTITADGSEIRGLALFSDTVGKIVKVDANNFVFQGNYNGFRADGMTHVEAPIDFDAGEALTLLMMSESYSGCTIGGTDPQDRNIFGIQPGSLAAGTVTTHSNCAVKGNYFGLAKDGVTTFSRNIGQFTNPLEGSNALGVGGSENIIGGSEEGAINVISGSETAQLVIGEGNGHIIQGNYIGTDYTGQVNASIVNGMGINFSSSVSSSLIGGTNPGEGNLVAGVTGVGVGVLENELQPLAFSATPERIAIVGNSIARVGVLSFLGFGLSNGGIDIFKNVITSFDPFNSVLTNQGPSPNDPTDADSGPNGYINTPVLKSAQQVGNQLTITYDLDAADSPSDDYRVEFFANSQSSIFGTGPGEEYLGAATSVAPGTNQTITLTVNSDVTNKALSATTTALDSATASGFGSTSEFAKNISIGSAADFDSDGASDTIEDAAPNNGDGNNDGTADRLQPTVTSFEIDSTGIYETLVTSGCSENGTVASVDVSALAKGDAGKTYPYGLVDFTLNCSRGDTVNVTKYVFVDDQPSEFVLRKYNPGSETYTDVSSSSISSQTVGGNTALVSTYSITDGGQYDDDGAANGIIVDPVGLATTSSNDQLNGSSLADTGQNLWVWGAAALTLVGGAYALHRKAQHVR